MIKNKLILLGLVCHVALNAQQPNFKFGKVSKEEIAQKEHQLEKDAEAAILYKKERVSYNYVSGEGFQTNRAVHFRIKIYAKNGLDWGTIKVPLYVSSNGEENITGVKGITYNLVDGKVQETKLKKDGIFKEKVNKYRNRASIAMPNVKEGSIVEVQYEVISDFASNLDDFQFQYGIPVNKVEVDVAIPEYYIFKRYGRGFFPINLKQSKKKRKVQFLYKPQFVAGGNNSTKSRELEFFENTYAINVDNIPSLKEADFTDNIDNYRSSIKFELASTNFPNNGFKNYSKSWEDVAKSIYKSDDFGGQLTKTRLVASIVDEIKAKGQGRDEELKNIFDYVKDNFTWNEYYGKYCENGIKKTLQDRTGNVADINLTLITILKKAGFTANPVLISTKSHGIPLFPTREGFNYVVASVETEKGIQLLDATEKMASLGILPYRAINWKGRLLKENGTSTEIDLSPIKHAVRNTVMNAQINSDGSVEGKMRTQLTKNYAFEYRESHKDDTLDDIMDSMEQRYVEMEVDDLEIKNKAEYEKPILESCAFEKSGQVERISDKLYFKPALFLAKSENPFKVEQREFPVDFGYPKSNRLMVNLTIPEGYSVESIPESGAFAMPDGLGNYSYVIKQNGDQIQLSSNLKINNGIIPPQYYGALKEFYNQVVIKQTENIILSKI